MSLKSKETLVIAGVLLAVSGSASASSYSAGNFANATDIVGCSSSAVDESGNSDVYFGGLGFSVNTSELVETYTYYGYSYTTNAMGAAAKANCPEPMAPG